MTAPLADRLRAAFGTSLRATVDVERRTAEGGTHQADRLPGFELQTEAGTCLVYEERYPIDYRHGSNSLGACLEIPARGLACLAKRPHLDAFDLRQAVFLDTETTGLAGGTGTTAFLVGIGFFSVDADSFIVRQFFMRNFGEERAMLLALAEALAPFRYVVSFNGKSFDLPLLETRYVLARLPRLRPPELHFDLLHPARRLWRERLESCSLTALEAAILGHQREADVPAWAIPGLYVAYLRQGESGPLRRVFRHNCHDLLSLATLASQLGRRLADPLDAALEPDELLAVARLYDRLGLRAEACACLEVALERATHASSLRGRIQLLLALGCKRSGNGERAVELWRELVKGPMALTALIELAKHFEHRQRDSAAALEVVEQALVVLELREAHDGPGRWRAERADLEKRLARLLRRRNLVGE